MYTIAVQRSPYQELLRENRVPYEPVQAITKTDCSTEEAYKILLAAY